MKIKSIVASLLFAVTSLSAQADTIDFRTLAAGTAVTTQYADFSASLRGGKASGAALIDVFGAGLSNSPTDYYPTAEFLDIAFTSAVDQLSFVFQNHGYNGSNKWFTYDSNDILLESGNLLNTNLVTATQFGTSGISKVSFGNGYSTHRGNWIQSLSVLNYNVAPVQADVPEPASILIIGAALAGLAAARRRKSA